MNESKITTRYAKGLFKVAQEQNILERIDKDLSLVAQTLNLPEFKSFFKQSCNTDFPKTTSRC